MKNTVLLLLSLLSVSAYGSLQPDKVRVADNKKTNSYLADGMYVGGDRAVDDVVVKNIRWAPNAKFERLVIDLEGTHGGEPLAISRAPYYQVAVSPDERRLVFTIWGQPKLNFDPPAFMKAIKKSQLITTATFFPKMEQDSWTFVIGLKPGAKSGKIPIEVFELANPVRIIVDVAKGPAGSAPAKTHKKRTS